jgi:hypothetical protein
MLKTDHVEEGAGTGEKHKMKDWLRVIFKTL